MRASFAAAPAIHPIGTYWHPGPQAILSEARFMSRPEGVTDLLHRWKVLGDRQAEQALFALVEQELIKVAQGALSREPHLANKIEPKELVNEAYLRLSKYAIVTPNRAPFFALMARAMRNFLISLARSDNAQKRPPTRMRVVDPDYVESARAVSEVDVIDFYRAVDELREIDARQANVIELRMYGLESQEIADELNISRASVTRDLTEARAFLAFQLGKAQRYSER